MMVGIVIILSLVSFDAASVITTLDPECIVLYCSIAVTILVDVITIVRYCILLPSFLTHAPQSIDR